MFKVRSLYRLIFMMSLFPYLHLFAQNGAQTFDEQSFFKQMKESYYSLADTDKKNFTVLLTNDHTERFAIKNWKNGEIFPIQLIWLAPDRLFLSEQGVPALSDSLQREYQSMVSDLKSLIKGIVHDLKRFYLTGVYETISDDYIIKSFKDMVEVKFRVPATQDTTYFTYYFGMNGLCLKTVSENPATGSKQETYPQYKIVKTKWLISGWEVQISENNEISSGLVIRLNNKLVADEWVPSEIYLAVQQTERAGQTFTDTIKLRNLIFNQSLQYIESQK